MNRTNYIGAALGSPILRLLFGLFFDLVNLMKPIVFMAISERDTSVAPGTFTSGDDAQDEFARIVTLALFKTSLDVSAWDANTGTEWGTLTTAGDVIVVGPVRGMIPKPSANVAPGYGFLDQRRKNHQYDFNVQHLGADANLDFWDRFMDQPGDWSVMPVFEDLTGYLYLSKNLVPVPVLIDAAPASESEDIGDERVLQINFKFKTKRLPYALADLTQSVFKLD